MKNTAKLLSTALKISESLIKLKPLRERIDEIVREIKEVIEADWLALIRLDIGKREIIDIHIGNGGWALSVPNRYEELMGGLTGWAIQNGCPVLSNEADADPRESPEARERRRKNGLGPLMVTPIRIEERTVGTITALRAVGRENFNEEDLELLNGLSHQAAAAIENSRLYEQLNKELEQREEVERDLREKTQELEIALRDKEMLIREVHHRVKNNLALVESIIQLQCDEATRLLPGELVDTTLEMLKDLQNRIESIRLIHEKLYSGTAATEVRIDEYLTELAEMTADATHGNSGKIAVVTEIEELCLSAKSAVSLGLLVGELVTNSVKYAFDEQSTPRIYLSLKRRGDRYCLRVSDNGRGIDPQFFEESKESLGLKLVQALAAQLGGKAEQRNNDGAEWLIDFPA